MPRKAAAPRPVVVDFETFAIKRRPLYPPQAVSLSIKYPGKKAERYAWGHLTENTCGWETARAALKRAWAHEGGLLFQHGKFDIDIAETEFGMPRLNWHRYHDTMFLLYLDDPHQADLGLKPSAERLLGQAPEERDAVGDWLLEHQPVPGVKLSRAVRSDHYFMKYLPFAPGKLVVRYAEGDVLRTEQLFKQLWPSVVAERAMGPAYDRERRLMLILLDIEREGVPVNLKRLRSDVATYNAWFSKLEVWIRKRLKADDSLNLDSGEQLMSALLAVGAAQEDRLELTATGKYSTKHASLLGAVTDKALLSMLTYRAQLKTCLRTFMEPWLAMAEASGGFIFTNWNQTRGGANDGGTRTGRLSSTPNFQNIPKEFTALFHHEDPRAKPRLPRCPFPELPPLPQVRSYVVPREKGHVLLDRDYSQQEPRILAHFDGGALMEQYVAAPWTDFHDYAKDELELMGLFYERKPVKNTNLGLIYGMGVGKLALKNDMSVDEAKKLKTAILKLYPGLKEMYQEMKRRARAHEPIRTWGEREYYCEEPKIVNGRLREFDYKMVNVLIQGSAADCTKEALIRFWAVKKPTWHVLLNVHDEILISAPRSEIKEAMEALRQAMEGVEFDVPMLSEGEWTDTNWADLKPYDTKGELKYAA